MTLMKMLKILLMTTRTTMKTATTLTTTKTIKIDLKRGQVVSHMQDFCLCFRIQFFNKQFYKGRRWLFNNLDLKFNWMLLCICNNNGGISWPLEWIIIDHTCFKWENNLAIKKFQDIFWKSGLFVVDRRKYMVDSRKLAGDTQ